MARGSSVSEREGEPMRKPGRSAIRWGAPVALAAAAIAALLVVPVFGGTLTTTKLRNKVNATELRVIGAKKLKPLSDPRPVIATLRLKPGNYVVTSTFTAHSER